MTRSHLFSVVGLSCILALPPVSATGQESRACFDAAVNPVGGVSAEAVGDCDGDGIPDILSWSWRDSSKQEVTVSSMRGNGDGTFSFDYSSAAPSIPYAGIPSQLTWALEVGRFDLDTNDDFVLALDSEVRVFRSMAGSAPMLVQHFSVASGVRSAVVVDYDGDGLDDLVLGGSGVTLWHNTGAGFVLVDSEPQGDHLELADVDGTPGADVLSRSGGHVDVLSLAGGSLGVVDSFTQPFAESSLPHLVAGDIDGDGDDDVVVFAESPETYAVFRQTAPGVLMGESVAVGGPASDFADLDGDGDLDGVLCGRGSSDPVPSSDFFASTFRIALNDGTGAFAPGWSIDGLGALRLAGAVDVDRDGDLDLVAGRATYFNRGSFPTQGVQPTIDINALGLRADRDNDGDPDGRSLPGFMSAWRNDGTGVLGAGSVVRPVPPAGTSWQSPEVLIDVDGDGDLDSLVKGNDPGQPASMRLHINTGGGGYVDGGWAFAPGFSLGASVQAIVFDADEDGDQDMVTYDKSQEVRRTWLNDGAGRFTLVGNLPIIGEYHPEAVDFDGDGHLDLLDSRMRIFHGAGDGTFPNVVFATGVILSTNSPAECWAVGDLDSNAYPDIVYKQFSSVSRLINDGQAFTEKFLVAQSQVQDIEILDCNGNGHGDILLGRNLQSFPGDPQLTDVYIGNGTGNWFLASTSLVMPLGQFVDVDGDGDLDIHATNATRRMVVYNNRFHASGSGSRRQFGQQTQGFGLMAPTLGASGPFRVGESAAVRLVGGRGAAPAVILLSPTTSVTPDWPAPGLEGYVFDFVLARLVILGGSDDVPGSGSRVLPFEVPASFAGLEVTLQAYVQDMSVPNWLVQTNGLELGFQ